jgi:O-antigen/teichoic acid export membrane protein
VSEPGGLRSRVLGGLGWTGASEIVMQIVRMLAAITLARLLAPEAYGLAALALVFSSFVVVFSDLALGAAIVQRKQLTEDDRSTAFWISIAVGAVFTVLGVLVARPLAHFYGEDALGPLCAALSATFLITAVSTTHEALLLREMNFATTERRMMIATLAGAAVGVAVGLWQRNAWAIIAQQLAQAVVSTALLWRWSPWRPKLRFSWISARELGSFSGFVVGHRLLYYAHRNADNILIGRFVGTAALGAYSLAYNVMLQPLARIAGPVQKVLWPAMSEMQDEPERMAAAWVRVVRLLGMITVPALFGMIVVAHEFVHVVLGPKWAQAATLIQILAWVGVLQALQSINTDILQARGKASKVLRFTVIFAGAHVVGFVIGLQWGVVGVAAAYSITSTLVEPIYTWMTAREIGISPWRVVAGLRGVFEATAVMVVVLVGARALLIGGGAPDLVRLLVLVPVGLASFVAASLWRAGDAWDDAGGIATQMLGGRRLPLIGRRLQAGSAA